MPKHPWGSASPVCGSHAVFGGAASYGCDKDATWPVGTGSPQGLSPYGLADMEGNVSEWVEDWYDATFYAKSPKKDPKNATTAGTRAMRGWNFWVTGAQLRVGRRFNFTPMDHASYLGFRTVRPGQ
jgi:formylglycine-generating enzyme required for sulfatase activity